MLPGRIKLDMKRFLVILLSLLTTGLSLSAQKSLLWNVDRLYTVKSDPTYEKLKNGIFWNAKSLLEKEDEVLVNKPLKFVDDARYYVSIGVYWWPDPSNPGGPYIRKDGQINPETQDYDAPKLSRMIRRVKTFAVAFYLTGELIYKDAMVSQLRSWFLDPQTGMLPNFQYGQIHPGSRDNIGSAAGLIEAYPFNDVIEAIRLVNSESAIDRKTMTALKQWFSDFADWMIDSDIGLAEYWATNNHGIAYDVLLANIAEFTGRKDILKRVTDDFRWMRLDCQIMPDGSQPLELDRTRSYHYVLYNLVHIVDFCILQENLGNSYYLANKDIIDSAFLWVVPYVGHPEKWLWVENLRKWAEEDKIFCTELQRIKRLKPRRNDTLPFADFGTDSYENINSVLK